MSTNATTMPFKGPAGTYQVELVLPGYGRVERRSLGTTRKSDAVAMENAIREVHRRGLHEPRLFSLLDGLQGRGKGRAGVLHPADLLVAVRSPLGPEEGLSQLLRRLDDPALASAVDGYLASVGGGTVSERFAFPLLLRYAEARHGKGCPVSVLTDQRSVEAILVAIEKGEGVRRNSVVRHPKQAISKLLAFRYGRFERDRVLKDVRYAGADDRRRLREVVVTPEAFVKLTDELRRAAIREGEEAAPLVAWIAAATGAEVRPLLEAKNADYRPQPNGQAVLLLRGTKRARKGKVSRDREMRIPRALAAEVARYHRPGKPEAALFALPPSRFVTMFELARKRAGLLEAVLNAEGKPVPLRPHDLRRLFAFFATRAGLARDKVGLAGLGHDSLDTTDRYIRAQVALTAADAETVYGALAGNATGHASAESNRTPRRTKGTGPKPKKKART